jgi:GT2 family glycosyltransferase
VLVLDNRSGDGSEQAARSHPAVDEVLAPRTRRGKALNDSDLLRRARGRYALLMNEDAELLPGATLALREALEQRPQVALAGARLVRPDGSSHLNPSRSRSLAIESSARNSSSRLAVLTTQ